MASDVEICSAALQLLGDSPISSLEDDNSKRAILCNTLYALARNDILRAHPWNCLVTREALAPLAAEPVNQWGYQFTQPTECLRILNVMDTHGCAIDYAFEGGRILADTDTIYLHYIERKDESRWDANLVNVMVKRMEMDLAYPITKSTSLRDSLRQEFLRPGLGILARAKAVDGQENPPEDFGDSPLIAVRG